MGKRIVSEHFTKEGKPKRGYSKRIDAEETAERYKQEWYLCKFCGLYHCGNVVRKS